jgi:outer membrane lipoprotein-sorting protein
LLKGKGRSFVLVLVLLAVLALVGCGSSETKVNADEVVQNALAAQANMDTSSMEITIDDVTVEGTVNGMDIGVSLNGSATSTMDWSNKKMKGHMGMNVDLTAPLAFNTQVTGDMYAFDNVSYIKVIFMASDNWTKTALPIDFWYTQENEQFIESILETADAEYLPDQKVGGVNCYVLKLTPDYVALQAMLEQQAGAGEEVPDIASLISNLSIKVWVAKDTSYVTKIEVVLDADIPADVLGGVAGGEGLTVHLSVTMEMTDVNEPVSIVLPDEAQNAEWGNPLDLFSGLSF